jgi:mono/diheme cytochrome c family protein
VTFAREIRAILSSRCVTCHAPRGSAPMPLTTYEQVRPWARAIKEQVLTRRMPKWHAARGYGAFANDPTLTPLEAALIVSWVDGGLPAGEPGTSGAPAARSAMAAAFSRATDKVLAIRPSAGEATAPLTAASIAGWSFEPGDPLITTATISSSAGPIGTWVAGDGPVILPSGTAIAASRELHVALNRRPAADFEEPFTAHRSMLRLRIATGTTARGVRQERVPCGAAPKRPGTLLAVQPFLDRGASARVWLQRPGAPASIVGWFRDFDPQFARTYWLARPLDLSSDARLQTDAKCSLVLTLAAPR